MIAITLPWPSRDLQPNARVHWARKARAVKKARSDAAWCAKAAGIWPRDPDIPTSIKVTAVFSPPSNRRADLDNMFAAIKAYCDGIADAIGVDDSKWQWNAPRREPAVKGGAVRIELEAAA